jgi:hypothetical protein
MIRYGHNSITGSLSAIVLAVADREYVINYEFLNQCMIDQTQKKYFLGSHCDYYNHHCDVASRCELNIDEVIFYVGRGSDSVNVVFGDEFFTQYSDALEHLLLDLKNHVITAYSDYNRPSINGNIDEFFDYLIHKTGTILENLKVLRKIYNREIRYNNGYEVERLNLGVDLTYRYNIDFAPEDGIWIETTIGTRCAKSWISTYSAEPERLRLNLELFAYGQPDNFEFYFMDDLEDSFIRFERIVNVRDVYIVRVQPTSPTLYVIGVCQISDFIRQLYIGLLRCALQIGSPASSKEVKLWNKQIKIYNYTGKKSMYNKLKSPVIERYLVLGGDLYDDEMPFKRDQEVNHILNIEADYSIYITTMEDYGPTFYVDENEKLCYTDSLINLDKRIIHVGENDSIFLTDSSGNEICNIVVPGLYEWHHMFATKVDEADDTKDTPDAEQRQKRGMEFAIEIRRRLPKDCDLWYRYSESNDSMPKLILMPIDDKSYN